MIRGNKVDLVAVSMRYVHDYLKWMSDPDVTAMLGKNYFSISEDAERDWVRKRVESPGDEYTFTILTKAGKAIGNVGLSKTDFSNKHTCLGIVIGEKKFWDKGYGTESIKMALDAAFNTLGMNKVYLIVQKENDRAVACYRKCGFKVDGTLRDQVFQDGEYHDDLLMSVLREEWERATTRKRKKTS